MSRIYTFGTFRFIVFTDDRVEVQALYGNEWKHAMSSHNPGFALFLKEQAATD